MRQRLVAVAAALVVLAVGIWAFDALTYEDDRPVDMTTPEAQRAIEAAREVVTGDVRGVARDTDNGKWEVTINQEGRDYEVELDPATLNLLRLDYD